MKRESFSTCQLCDELLLPGEPVSPTLFNGREVHLECGFRAVIGGAHHILRICKCCGGKLEPDPPHLSKREAARWALKVYGWVRELGVVMAQEQAKKRPAQGGPDGGSSNA